MTQERPKVEIIGGSEYLDHLGQIGEVLGTIPPNLSSPNRIMVKLKGGPLINFRPEDVTPIRQRSRRFKASKTFP